MNLETVTVPPDEAKEKLDEYRGLIAGERTTEDEAIIQAYRAAARGLPVIDLPRTIASGGFHPNSLPRLAVARADTRECFACWDGSALIFSDADDWRLNQGALVNARSVRVPLAGDELPAVLVRRRRWNAAVTMVPIVPPRFRPRRRRLHGCHVLWEVEEWTRIPPRDPALIRHIRGSLWTVLATWDLTDLERLVLTQRVAAH